MKLHHRQIAGLPKGRHADGAGLRYESRGDGTGNWSVRFSVAGRPREKGLGTFPAVGLRKAREAAAAARLAASKGIDTTKQQRPNEQPAPLSDAPTFGQLAQSFFATHLVGLRESSRNRYRRMIEIHILTHFGDRQVSSLTLFDLHNVYGPKLQTQFKLTKNVLEGLSSLLAFGRRNGAPCNELLCRDFRAERVYRSALKQYNAEKEMGQHTLASLTHGEFADLYQKLPEEKLADLAAKFVILTGMRRKTIRKLRRDQAGGVVIVAEPKQMKGGRQHVYPLSVEAQRIADLALAHNHKSKRLFGKLGKRSPLRNMRAINPKANNHGIRHAIADWADMAGIDEKVADYMLAHKAGESVREKFYLKDRNLTPVAAAYEQWADYLTDQRVVRFAVA